jgi:hypothetical protein
VKVYGIAVLVLSACLGVCVLVWNAAYPHEEITPVPASVPPAVAIFADCGLMAFPIPIPPQSSIQIVALNRKFMRSQNWGLMDIPNSTDKQQQWPSKEKMKSAKRQSKKCSLSSVIILGRASRSRQSMKNCASRSFFCVFGMTAMRLIVPAFGRFLLGAPAPAYRATPFNVARHACMARFARSGRA